MEDHSAVVELEFYNEVHFRINAEKYILKELSSLFTFDVPGKSFIPSVRSKYWDGTIRLLNLQNRLLYRGLITKVIAYCERENYKLKIDPLLLLEDIKFTREDLVEFISTLKIQENKFPREYQMGALVDCISKGRSLCLSPTGSGKSLLIYILSEYYRRVKKKRVLILVPTIGLVTQMNGDFYDYSTLKELDIDLIMAGRTKDVKKSIVISTWQSVYKESPEWFSQFGCVIGDESHTFTAKSLAGIMEKMPDCKYRFGLSGTFDNTIVNQMTLEGLFWKTHKVITTKELIDEGFLSNLFIRGILLTYPDEVVKSNSKFTYPEEIEFLIMNEKRNIFIKDLALSLENNTLILFRFKEHGKKIFECIKQNTDRPVYYVDGDTSPEDREYVRSIMEKKNDVIAVASVGVFSTGINIKNLHNIVTTSPSKTKIKTLQSIGRGLRLHSSKDICTLYDIADFMVYKKRENYSYIHFQERILLYMNEKFTYKVSKIKL